MSRTTSATITIQTDSNDNGAERYTEQVKVRVQLQTLVDPDLFAQYLEAHIVGATLDLANLYDRGVSNAELADTMRAELGRRILLNDAIVTRITEGVQVAERHIEGG